MSKIRVYELAKKLGVKSKVILLELSQLGIEGKTPSSNIDPELAKTIEDKILKGSIEPPKEGVHDRETILEKPIGLLKEEIPERHVEQQKPIEEKEPGILPEKEKSKALLIPEKEKLIVLEKFRKERLKEFVKHEVGSAKDEMSSKEDWKTGYCSICNKRIENYGRRKEDLKRPGWVFCPTHGWIKEGIHDREVGLEEPVRLSIEKLLDKHLEEIKPSSPKPDLQKTDLTMGKRDTPGKRSIIVGLIISAIFIIAVFSFSLLNYSIWKSPMSESPETRSFNLPVQKGESARQVQPEVSSPPKEENGVSPNETTDTDIEKETEPESTQPREYSKLMFTVQVGAFSDAYYAKSLRMRLNRKGYHAYTTIAPLEKKGRLYKVWVGKFNNREEAEIVSEKIKKAEGLQTFVTVWKKQSRKNQKPSSQRTGGVQKCLIINELRALYSEAPLVPVFLSHLV
jgi:septal ring-binding cell division protein DamX